MSGLDKAFLIILAISLVLGVCIWGFDIYIGASLFALVSTVLLYMKTILTGVPLVLGAMMCGAPFWFAYIVALILLSLIFTMQQEG